jgi:hypothetical protein
MVEQKVITISHGAPACIVWTVAVEIEEMYPTLEDADISWYTTFLEAFIGMLRLLVWD